MGRLADVYRQIGVIVTIRLLGRTEIRQVALEVDRSHKAFGILTKRLARPEVDLPSHLPDLGSPEQSDRHDDPNLAVHVGQAPQP